MGLLHQLMAAAGRNAAGNPDGRIDRPLLVVLDEAANIAPLPDLDELASTAMGLGITLVTIWQDLAQIRARYAARATTIVNNHAGMLVLRGMRDLDALRATSDLIGRHTPPQDPETGRYATPEALLPAHAVRRLPEGRAVGIYQQLPSFQVRLRPFYATPHLRRRAALPLDMPDLPNAARPLAGAQVEWDGETPDASLVIASSSVVGAPTLAHVRRAAAELTAVAADHRATNLRIFGSVVTGRVVPGSNINLLVDIPPSRRLLHLTNLNDQFGEIIGYPVEVLTDDMLQNPDAARHAVPLHADQEVTV